MFGGICLGILASFFGGGGGGGVVVEAARYSQVRDNCYTDFSTDCTVVQFVVASAEVDYYYSVVVLDIDYQERLVHQVLLYMLKRDVF